MKVLVVGSCGVGKTSIVNRLVYNSFSDAYKATVGVDFAFKAMALKMEDGRSVNVKV